MKPQSKSKKRKKRQEEIGEIVSPKSSKKFEREVTKFLEEQFQVAQERESWVKMILDANDDSISEIVGHMVDALTRMAVGNSTQEVVIRYKDQSIRPRSDAERDSILEAARMNRRWVAVRILVASAEQDIQIGNFTLPKGKCARCGKKAVKVKPVKVVKKKISKPSKKVKR